MRHRHQVWSYITLTVMRAVPCCSPGDGTGCEAGPGWEEQHVCGQCGLLFDASYPLGAHAWSMP